MNKVSRFFLLTVLLFSFFSCGKTDVSDNGVVDNPTGGDIGAGKGQFRPMYAPPVRNDEGGNVLTGVVFKHLTSLVIFKVTNSTDEAFNLNSIEMSTADGKAVFYSSASFNPQSHTEAVVNGSPSEAVALGFVGNGMQVTPNEMEKAYLPVLPTGDFSESQLRVITVKS